MAPTWLPPLCTLESCKGDWDQYLAALYELFSRDFIGSRPVFRGRRLGLKKHPTSQGKEATFWHFISQGINEGDREIDLRRCERIGWVRPIIDHSGDPEILVWENERGTDTRICLWLEAESYLVVLADRGQYLLPWTAYLVEQEHRRRKLRKEAEEWLAKQG